MKKYLRDVKWSWQNDDKWRRDMKAYLVANAIIWTFILLTFA